MGMRGQFANKRDANEREIVDALSAAGFLVYRMDQPVDLLVIDGNQRPWFFEVKGPKGKVTDKQLHFIMCLPGYAFVVRNADEAFAAMGIARRDGID